MSQKSIGGGKFFKLVASGNQIRLTFAQGLAPPQNLYRRLSGCLPTARRYAKHTDSCTIERIWQDGDMIVFELRLPCDDLSPAVRDALFSFIPELFDNSAAMSPILHAEQAHGDPTSYWADRRGKTAERQLRYFRKSFESSKWIVDSSIYRTLLAHWDEGSLNDALMEYAFERL